MNGRQSSGRRRSGDEIRVVDRAGGDARATAKRAMELEAAERLGDLAVEAMQDAASLSRASRGLLFRRGTGLRQTVAHLRRYPKSSERERYASAAVAALVEHLDAFDSKPRRRHRAKQRERSRASRLALEDRIRGNDEFPQHDDARPAYYDRFHKGQTTANEDAAHYYRFKVMEVCGALLRAVDLLAEAEGEQADRLDRLLSLVATHRMLDLDVLYDVLGYRPRIDRHQDEHARRLGIDTPNVLPFPGKEG